MNYHNKINAADERDDDGGGGGRTNGEGVRWGGVSEESNGGGPV